MNQKAAAPLTHDLLARKGEATAARRLHDAVAEFPIDARQANPRAQPQDYTENPAPKSRSFTIDRRFIFASLAIGLVSGIASYLLFVGAGQETAHRTQSTQVLPRQDAPPSLPLPGTSAEDQGALLPASGPKPADIVSPPRMPAKTLAVKPRTDLPAFATVVASDPPVVQKPATPVAGKTLVAAKSTPPAAAAIVPPDLQGQPTTDKTVSIKAPAAIKIPAPQPVAVAVAKPVVAPPPKLAAPRFAIQLASLKNREAAIREGAQLQRLHSAALGKQEISVEQADLGNRGIYYRLKAGGYTSTAQANAICKALKEKKQSCLVIRY